MKSFVFAVMLLAFFMGLNYADFDRVAKNCDADPWFDIDYQSAKVSQDKFEADPWSELYKSEASQKKCQEVVWDEGNVK